MGSHIVTIALWRSNYSATICHRMAPSPTFKSAGGGSLGQNLGRKGLTDISLILHDEEKTWGYRT